MCTAGILLYSIVGERVNCGLFECIDASMTNELSGERECGGGSTILGGNENILCCEAQREMN